MSKLSPSNLPQFMLLHIQNLLQLAMLYTHMQTQTHTGTHTNSSSLATLVFDRFLKRSILVMFHLNTVAITYPRPPVLWQIAVPALQEELTLNFRSFRMDWLGLLAIQGTLKSLLQYHSSNPSILRRSAFFTVQLSHPDRKSVV